MVTPITKGESTQLVAQFSGGSGTVDHGVGPVTSGVPVSVAPLETTTFTLSVTGPTGAKATSQLTLVVFPGRFIATGSLTYERTGHTATLLKDGRVLVVGGSGNVRTPPICELYDPGTGTYLPGPPLSEERSYHTETLLDSGKVLLCGGQGPLSGVYTDTILQFDPGTGALSAAGTMLAPRARHSATLLADGSILLVGGVDLRLGILPERYDPATGHSTATGPMVQPRVNHTATKLPSGKVLIAGGFKSDNTLGSELELFDPATNQFTSLGTLRRPRWGHTATLLPGGRVLIAGGLDDAMRPILEIESIDLTTGASTLVATFPSDIARHRHTATLLDDGSVLFAGGPAIVSSLSPANGTIFDPGTGQMKPTGIMFRHTLEHRALRLNDGSILHVGGLEVMGTAPSSYSSLYR